MVVIGLVMVGSAVKNPAEPAFVFQRLGGDAQTLGLVSGLWGMGMVAGTFLAPTAVQAWRRERLLAAGIGLAGLCLLATSQARAAAPVMVLYLFAGSANGLGSVCYETLLQQHTPDALRGRVLAACDAVFDLALLAGYTLTGVLDRHLGPSGMFALAGVVLLAAAVAARRLRVPSGAGMAGDVGPAGVRPALVVDVPVAALSVPALEVDHAEQFLTGTETPHVLGDALGQRAEGEPGRVGPVGGDEAPGMTPERMAFRERFGLGDVEGGPADPFLVERPDQVVGDHVPAPGHVHQPGVGSHGPQLGLGDDALGLGREGQGQHDGVGPVERLVQPVRTEGPCPTCEWLGLTADDCCLDAERDQQPQQFMGDAASAHDGDPTAEEGAAPGPVPGGGSGVLVELA
jgi:hypothetical protein